MRYVLIAIGVLVMLLLCVVLVGWSLPKHHRVTVKRAYAARPSALYALISDVRAYSSWRGDVTTVEMLSDEGGRPRWRETTRSGGPITYGGAWTYELTPTGSEGAELAITEDGDVYNPIFRFVSRFVMGHTATIERYLDDLEKRFPAVITPTG
jgi:hypothetical protein